LKVNSHGPTTTSPAWSSTTLDASRSVMSSGRSSRP
jgi:hypothetical protein